MKRLFLVLILILILQNVFAITETKEKLSVNSTATVGGKTLTLVRVTPDHIKVDVDGVDNNIANGGSAEINGMKVDVISLLYVDETYTEVSLKLTVDYECGDANCSKGETSQSCCKDCGCTLGQCINNKCATAECKEDKDCNSKDPCTLEKCSSGRCEKTNITECKGNDSCCPAACSYTNDADCKKEEVFSTPECNADTECNDNNSCTSDKCSSTKCLHETAKGCDFKGTCYNLSERIDKVYCTGSGMQPQKENKSPCSNNYECAEDICTDNVCGTESNKVFYIGVTIAVLTLVVLVFAGYRVFRKKEQGLYPNEGSSIS